MYKVELDLESLRESQRVKEMLGRWSPEDFQKSLEESRPFELNTWNINLILFLFLERKATRRTKLIMENLLRDGADPLFMRSDYSSLAEEAFMQSDYRVALIFLNRLEDINSPVDAMKNTPLHLAVQKRDYAFFRSVVKRKPNLNIVNINGQTALHEAVKSGQSRKVRILLNNGADVDIKDRFGETVAHYVVATKETKLKSLILDVADVKVKDCIGDTPLHMILKCPEDQRKELCLILFDRGADPNEPNRFGVTPFHHLVTQNMEYERSQFYDLIDLFIEHGALINSVNPPYGYSVLQLCLGPYTEFDIDLIARLIHYGVDANYLTHTRPSIFDLSEEKMDNILLLINHLSIEVIRDNFRCSQLLSNKIRSVPRYQIHFDSCLRELDDLVSIKFQSSKSFGLLDVMAESRVRKLARYCKNEEYRRKMMAFDFSSFIIYGDDLKMKFEEGMRILEAEDNGYSFFSRASRGVLNLDCIEAIMRYLPPKELLMLGNI